MEVRVNVKFTPFDFPDSLRGNSILTHCEPKLLLLMLSSHHSATVRRVAEKNTLVLWCGAVPLACSAITLHNDAVVRQEVARR